ncbi:MAG: GIY-YIG nuclease family protein [bacterium]
MVLRLIQRCTEWQPRDNWRLVPRGLRGIYVLLRKRASANPKEVFEVVYIGMARGGEGIRHRGIRRRLQGHVRSRRKRDAWTHFSLYEVWPNISDDEVGELEGLLRSIYRKDPRANILNLARGFNPLRKVRENNLKRWQRR